MSDKTAHAPKRLAGIALVAAVILATAANPTLAEKRAPIEKYRANAMSLDRGRASTLDIVVYEWSTAEDRQAMIQAFLDGGNQALYDYLDDQDEKGYVRLPGSLAYEMRYAYQFERDGKRLIVMATDRPLGFLEVTRSSRSTDYNISFVVLELDSASGEGEGQAVGGAEFKINEKTGHLEVEIASTQPTRLTKVRKVEP